MDLQDIDRSFKASGVSSALAQTDILVVDLALEQANTEKINDSFISEYAGGPALGLRLWASYCTDTEKDPIVILAGNLCTSGLYLSDTLTVVFKSPQNGHVTTHTFCSDFAYRLISCGFRAVVLKGRARRYSHIEITDQGAEVCLTEQFTHLGTSKTETLFSKEDTSIICTGPASEVLLPYACAVSEGKSTGRGGLGTALALKNVRVIAVKNSQTLPKHVASEIDDKISKSPLCSEILKYGTSCFIKDASINGWAAVKNFTCRTDPRLFYLCSSEIERRTGHSLFEGLGFEEILALGSSCGCFDINKILKRYRYCINLGIDPVSAGTILASIGENLTDDSEVFSILDDLSASFERLSDNAYRINGLECGAIDYRGSFASGLNEALGNTEPVLFDLRHQLCKKNEHIWVALNEDLTMGLESLGLKPELVVFSMLDRVKKTESPVKLKKALEKQILANTLPGFGAIIELGSRAWRLKTEINYRLNVAPPCLPDHFCVNPESNHKTESIVPFFKLMQDYRKFRNNTVIRQSV